VPPYRETRNYVAKITSASASAAPTPATPPVTRIYKTIDIVDGRPVLRFTNKPVDGADRVTAAERR